jgi:hypothetical protein
MNVIHFPVWRVRFYVDELDRNFIRQWLYEQEISDPDRNALQTLIDICESSGLYAISYSTEPLEEGFFAICSRRKGGADIRLVCCEGPTGETEITALAGAVIDEDGELRPSYVVGIARDNLRELKKNPSRWRRERVT